MEDKMVKKRGKEIYQPPYAQDLSGFSANGQEIKPTGQCVGGNTASGPTAGCQVGSSVTLGNCAAGEFPTSSDCEVGSSAYYGDHCFQGGDVN